MAVIGNFVLPKLNIAPSLGTSAPQQQAPQVSQPFIGQGALEQPPPVTGPYNPFTGGPA